ncbi:hypothetical protein R1flu_001535 [Riccia fluitans]|uniref:DUF7781 domain-containing protein n=1 Tax=Riccia fluitans TaxID=41844 RepID=A0ABD1Y3J3_9MARC
MNQETSTTSPVEKRASPWLFVGLGNPGSKYQGTRHNVSFDMIDAIAEAEGISLFTIQFKALLGKACRRRLESRNTRRYQRQDSKTNNTFLNVLKERVQAVLDAQQSSSPRHSSTGNVSDPLSPQFHEVPTSSHQHASLRNQSRELQMFPLQTGADPVVLERGTHEPRPAAWQDFYSIDWTPKDVFLKFRQQVEGYQLGANFEFDGFKIDGFNTKFVFKPTKGDRKWKLICEPKPGDLRLLTKKLPIGPLLNIQVGIGHDWINHTTGLECGICSTRSSWLLADPRAQNALGHLEKFATFLQSAGKLSNGCHPLPDLEQGLSMSNICSLKS